VTDRPSTRAPNRERSPRDDSERERYPRDDAERQRRNGRRAADEGRAHQRLGRLQSDGMRAARLAAEHVLSLTGRCPENVVFVAREDDGWQVGVEVMELRRIPDTTDILAIYEVTLDSNGDLVRCERGQRHHRGHVDDEQ
jgi:hypothetical protein